MRNDRGSQAQRLAELVLSKARALASQERAASPATARNGPLDSFRRKYLIHRCRQLAAQYHLQEELDGFVYAAGCEAITGLDREDLEALAKWMEESAGRVATACDAPGAPPAR